MRIPSKRQCFELFRDMRMLDHIVAHSLQVCRVALLIADRLEEGPLRLNRDLIQAAALLHDITKTRSFTTGENHAQSGEGLLGELGFPEVGYIVGRHVRLDRYDAGQPIAEVEVVNYADKRVLHDRVVSLEERMAYILERYGREADFRQRLQWLWEQTRLLEERLFTRLPFAPEALGPILGAAQDPVGAPFPQAEG
jgi:putative nucleotidyltransferase with HDIG domain